MKQEITSKSTSLHQVPALHKRVNVGGKRVLDYGCGKYDDGLLYLKGRGAAKVCGWDPYNREPEWNVEGAVWIYKGKADITLCANVLNVIANRVHRMRVIRDCYKSLAPGGIAYFWVYEGDETGKGGKTTKGWQENRKTESYFLEIMDIEGKVTWGGGRIIEVRKEPRPTAWNLVADLPEVGVPVLIYSEEWEDEDFTPEGITEGVLTEDEGWMKTAWNGCQDCWDTEWNVQPTHWQPMPKGPYAGEK